MSFKSVCYSLSDIRERLKTHLTTSGLLSDDAIDYVNNPVHQKIERTVWKKAAVLIPIICPILKNGDDDNLSKAHVLFTLRSPHLRDHSGQISFPGGKIEPYGESPEQAALREAREEIALPSNCVTILGAQPLYYTATGYEIEPFIGAVSEKVSYHANEGEVTEIFTVPFSFLMDPKNHKIDFKVINGHKRSFYAITYQDYYIWGATAGMIRALYERLYA